MGKIMYKDHEYSGMKGIQDYIIEENESDNGWSYRKWANGRFEMWRVYSGAPTTGTHHVTIGNLYGYRVAGFNFPSSCKPIDTNYHVDDTWIVDNGFAMSAGTVTTKTINDFGVYCLASSGNQTTVNINLYVTGRWT